MSSSASVNSFDALAEAKAAIDWFIREAVAAIAESDAELQRTLGWLDREALPHWDREIKRRQEEVAQARSEFYRQQLIANPNTPTALQQRKAWDRAKARLEEAYEKQRATRRWLIHWERELALYKGQVTPLSDALSHDLPAATAKIQRLIEVLEQYAAIRPDRPAPRATSGASAGAPELDQTSEPADAADPGDFAPLGAGALPDAFAQLRTRTPAPALRLTIPPTDPAAVASRPGELHPLDAETLDRLALWGEAPEPEGRVVLRSGALFAPALYLERTAPAREDDSGWFLSPVDGLPGDDLQCLPVWLLNQKRPDLTPLLRLPAGTLVALGAGRVQALLTGDDTDLWPVESPGPGPSSGTMPEEGAGA